MSLLSTAARTVADWVKLGFPEEVAKRIVSGELPMDKASRMKRAEEQGYEDGFYKGMYPYDWTKENGDYKGPVISEINRQSPFPSFGGTDGDVDIAGFMTKDPEVANRFANPNLMQSGAVFPLMKRSNAEHVIDAAGANAGDIQFGESGRPFRDAVRSGEYDTVKIQNTADEGDVYVALDPSNIRSTNAAFDPQYKGANILGSTLLPAAAAGLLATQSDDAEAGFVTRGGKTLLEAWHGSPHKFDKFSMDAIGTGEGAQAYGHGLYFADSEDVARQYRDNLSALQGGLDGSANFSDNPVDSTAWMLNSGVDESGVREAIGVLDYKGDVDELIEAAKGRLKQAKSGALYRTEIDVTPESLLDWDKPLSADTPQQMKDAINILVKNNPDLKGELYQAYRENQPGSIYYSLLSDYAKTGDIVKNQQFATQQLNDAGIKGIKYLDGDSRAVGDGTSNYVIFDDSLINIAERGSADPRLLAGIAAGGGGVSAATALSNKLAAAQAVKEQGDIRAPNSSLLHDFTMGARDLERRLEGSPASLLFPEGLVEYLEQANRAERPNAATRSWALLDLI